MEVLVELRIEKVDPEWLMLIIQAQEQGIGIEEIKIFFAEEAKKLILQQEV
jgi:hypothetical protein